MSRFHSFLVAASVAALLSCSDDNGPAPDSGTPDGAGDLTADAGEVVLPAYCQPLALGHCMLPWPSSFYLKQDSTTETGFRLDYKAEAMPKNNKDKPVDVSRYNLRDGFSIGSQPIVVFPEGVSKEGLPPIDDIASSVTDQSLVWLLELDTGKRVPLFAEVDANEEDPKKAGLIIRPQRPLRFDTSYVVVLREGLKDAAGQPLQPLEPFVRLRDGLPTESDQLRAEGERMKPVFDFLKAQQIDAQKLIVAWDFHTASQKSVTSRLIDMVDEALAKLPADGPAFKEIQAVDKTAAEDPKRLRAITGKFVVPSFLESDEATSWLKLDADGKAVYRGDQDFLFYVNIPRCAETTTGPLPVLMFGHGLLGDPKDYLEEDLHKNLSERLCMVEVATNWIGLNKENKLHVGGLIPADWSNMPIATDRLHQAHVNAHAFVKLFKGKFLQDPSMQVNGKPVSDGAMIYYLGISNGGIQGVTFAALNKDIERYVLNVGGGWWSMMMERSSNFDQYAGLMRMIYPEAIDRLLLIALSQSLWDGTDPIAYASFVRTAPLPGRTKKLVISQESKDDDQVPNIATRAVVRALGLPLLTPKVETVHGIEEKTGPLESAYVQWNTDPSLKPPKENLLPTSPETDSAHFSVRKLESFDKQLEAFFKPDGQVVHTCDGPCDKDD